MTFLPRSGSLTRIQLLQDAGTSFDCVVVAVILL